MLKHDLEWWSKINYAPPQLVTSLGLAIMDAEAAKEKKDNAMSEADFMTNEMAAKELEHLKHRFNIQIDATHFNNDQ